MCMYTYCSTTKLCKLAQEELRAPAAPEPQIGQEPFVHMFQSDKCHNAHSGRLAHGMTHRLVALTDYIRIQAFFI